MNGEGTAMVAALLEIECTTHDFVIFLLITISACRLHVFIEEGLRTSSRPVHMGQSKWDRCCKDMWRLTNHTYMCLASFFVLYRHNLLDLVI